MKTRVFELITFVTASAVTVAASTGAEAIRGKVPDSWPAGIAAPVTVPLPDAVSEGPLSATLRIEGMADPIAAPAQTEPADDAAGTPRRAWLMLALPEQARNKSVAISFAPAQMELTAAYTTRYEDPELFIDMPDGRRILGYWHGEPESGKRYALTDFIHPVMGLDGETLTSSRAADHMHHRGVFWPWVRYERKGKSIGQWWIPDRMAMESGEIAHDTGPVFARFSANHWLTSSAEGESTRVIEHWTVCRVFETTPQGRAIDIDVIQKALQPGIAIGGQTALKKGYGGFTIRFAHAEAIEMIADGVRLLIQDRNEVEAAWTDYTGHFVGPDGERLKHPSGAATFVHGSHPEWPTYWITRRYGPMGVCYPGLQMVELPTNDYLRLRYRIWIHRHRAEQAMVGQQFNACVANWDWQTPDR